MGQGWKLTGVAHSTHWQNISRKGLKSLISGTLLFQGVGDPAATILPVAWPCSHLLGSCPNPLDKHHPFQVSNQDPRKKHPFVLSRQLFQAECWVKTHVGSYKDTCSHLDQLRLGFKWRGSRPLPDLPSDLPCNPDHIVSDPLWRFSELEERPTASSQSLGQPG